MVPESFLHILSSLYFASMNKYGNDSFEHFTVVVHNIDWTKTIYGKKSNSLKGNIN